MNNELAECYQRQAGDSGRDQARQASLNHSKHKVAVSTWNGKHRGISNSVVVTRDGHSEMSAYDPKRTSSVAGSLAARLFNSGSL